MRKEYFAFILILILGLFLRSYKARELFMYSHDQDLSAWMVMDVLKNGHFRLIGQETSIHGVFIGMLYYYTLVPFYLVFQGDPAGGLYLSMIIGAFTIFSFWWVFKKIFDDRTALIASFIYAVSFYTVFVDREVVPTTPAMLWSVWYLYTLWLILKGRQTRGFALIGLLLGLVWHINMGLWILAPLAPIAVILARKRVKVKSLGYGAVALGMSMLPFILFEIRHGFIQTRSVLGMVAVSGGAEVDWWAKYDRVMQLTVKNVRSIFATHFIDIPQGAVVILLLGCLILVWKRGRYYRNLAVICWIWITFYIGFFTVNPINLSEYYLNGMTVVWIMAASAGIAILLERRKAFAIGVFLLAAFGVANGYKYATLDINKSGYNYRLALVREIKADAEKNGYPCVAVSYITQPGYEFGYRYLFRYEGMHINKPSDMSPVYTIVFPHSMVDRIDRSFGALGLIYPEYGRYTEDGVMKSCSGEDANLTEPMFGYTD